MAPTLTTGLPGRALALALAGLALLLAWLGLVAPLLDWHAQREDALEHKQQMAQRMEALAASLPEWRRLQADAAARGPARPALLEGTSDAVAAASLQGLVQEMASRAGLGVNSMEILSAEPRGPYRRIAVRVVAEGQWPVLLEIWRTIGAASPRMLVDDLHLRGPDARSRTDTPLIAASFTVLAFRPATGSEQP